MANQFPVTSITQLQTNKEGLCPPFRKGSKKIKSKWRAGHSELLNLIPVCVCQTG